MSFCEVCGTKIAADAFCTSCGSPLTADAKITENPRSQSLNDLADMVVEQAEQLVSDDDKSVLRFFRTSDNQPLFTIQFELGVVETQFASKYAQTLDEVHQWPSFDVDQRFITDIEVKAIYLEPEDYFDDALGRQLTADILGLIDCEDDGLGDVAVVMTSRSPNGQESRHILRPGDGEGLETSETYISEAEEQLVELAEQPHLGVASWAATNTLVFSHLIPARRFAEARLWCKDLIRLEAGYESWNARSNLGIVEFESGNPELARDYFQGIIDAGMGPVDEATDYIERIDAGESRSKDSRVPWEYSEKWKKVDIAKPILWSENPQDFYDRLIKLFVAHETWSGIEESYRLSPAATIFGLVNGFEGGLIEAGIHVDREVIVRAYSDAVEFVVGAEAENARPGPLVLASDSAPLVVAKFCTSCGAARESGARFCSTCGEKF